jgi:hypothetical protein
VGLEVFEYPNQAGNRSYEENQVGCSEFFPAGKNGESQAVEKAVKQRWVSVVGYKPIWDDRRELWYCDIGLNRIPSYGCFFKLVYLANQPKSLETFELSAPIRADFIQARPDRIVNVMREPNNPLAIRVIVSEPIGSKTPMRADTTLQGVKNEFQIEVYQPCVTTNGSHVWLDSR